MIRSRHALGARRRVPIRTPTPTVVAPARERTARRSPARVQRLHRGRVRRARAGARQRRPTRRPDRACCTSTDTLPGSDRVKRRRARDRAPRGDRTRRESASRVTAGLRVSGATVNPTAALVAHPRPSVAVTVAALGPGTVNDRRTTGPDTTGPAPKFQRNVSGPPVPPAAATEKAAGWKTGAAVTSGVSDRPGRSKAPRSRRAAQSPPASAIRGEPAKSAGDSSGARPPGAPASIAGESGASS